VWFALSEAAAALRLCERSLAYFGATYHSAMCAARAIVLRLRWVGGDAAALQRDDERGMHARARELLELAARLAAAERTQGKVRAAEELMRLPELQLEGA
jgi:hypothetical protein